MAHTTISSHLIQEPPSRGGRPGRLDVSPQAGSQSEVRVMVVDDSRLMQRHLTAILEAGGMKVVAACGNGKEAIELNRTHRPDVITMDIMMPKMDGLEAMAAIMSTQPTPIVIVSSYARTSSEQAKMALALGAVDIVSKPSGEGVDLDLEEAADELRAKVKAAAKVRVVRTIQNHRQVPVATPLTRPNPASPTLVENSQLPAASIGRERIDPIIVIGASTGGPQILVPLLSALPATLASPVLLVVHTPAQFTSDLVVVLGRKAAIRVVQATDGERAEPGCVYLAPGDHHLELGANRRVKLTKGPRVNFHRPSVDVLFSSAAAHAGADALGIVLTGMGSDGTRGSMDIKAAGGSVVVQDEQSSIVYGMPKAVIDSGASDRSLSPEMIVEEIKRWSVRKAGP